LKIKTSTVVRIIAAFCVIFILTNICFAFIPHSDNCCDNCCEYCILVKISENLLALGVIMVLLFGHKVFSNYRAVISDSFVKNTFGSLVKLKVKLSN